MNIPSTTCCAGRADRPAAMVSARPTRKSALELLEQKHFNATTKRDALLPEPSFSEEQIAEAKLAIRGIKTLMHSTSIDQLPLDQRKALSAFSFGSQGFMLAPEQSTEILSCLVDLPDITALMRNISISSSSIKFFVDNETWDVAAWACESSCFPTIRRSKSAAASARSSSSRRARYIVCATRELLEDASTNVEAWLIDKARRAFGAQIGHAVLAGDGFGKPMGILNPAAGIPIMDTAPSTPPSFFTWQDLPMLK